MLELKVTQNDKGVTLKFEHSLLSISKWEAKYKKAFLGTTQKTPIEMIEYYEEMLVSPANRELVYLLEPDQLEELTNYVNSQRTASSVPDLDGRPSPFREIVTSELIYYWMVALNIPFEAEKWHLSRLMMLIRITNFKQTPPEKQNKAQMMAKMREINEQRKAQYNTTG